MKKVLLIVIVLIGIKSFSQKVTPQQKWDKDRFEMSEVLFGLPGNKDLIYSSVQSWIAKTYVSAQKVVQFADKESGKIIAKANLPIDGAKGGFGNTLGTDYIHYTITIDIKDSKCRIILSDYYHEGGNYAGRTAPSGGELVKEKGDGISKRRWAEIKDKAYNNAVDVVNSFYNYMAGSIKNDNF